MKYWLVMFISLTLFAGQIRAGEVQVAVAANFQGPMQVLASDFTRATGHKIIISSGATGKFYAQIQSGAPFEVLLAADAATPAKLEAENLAAPGSRFTYAIGKLILWSENPNLVDPKGQVLREGKFTHLALANPKTAPYGAAAVEVMSNMGLLDRLSPKFVLGENIAQTQQFIASGNAELGFVAVSQVFKNGKLTAGSAWLIPEELHQPILQDAVLLTAGKTNPAALALMDYLKSKNAGITIQSFGYDPGKNPPIGTASPKVHHHKVATPATNQ